MSTISRREFLKLVKWALGITGLGAVLGPIVAFFYPPKLEEMPSEPVKLGTVEELPPGASKTIAFGRYPALVINTPDGLRGYSAVCTHFGCIVKWDSAKNRIACPCHDGFFDAVTGNVISGPPPSPLTPLPVNIVDGQIFVGGAG